MATKDDDALAIEDEVYQRAIKPQLAELPDKQFKPWHKPRKHYLRVHQWCVEIANLIKELGIGCGDALRYLGMPGEDLLDVRTLQGVCERGGVKLRYLGFDSSADNEGQYELNLSNHEVASLGFMDPFSRILKDRVERIAIDSSVARMHFAKQAPFDVINLDLCDSVAATTGLGSYYDALVQICNLQAGRSKPWLIFMATRVIRSQIDTVSKVKLLQCVQKNMASSSAFTQRVRERLAFDAQDVDNEIADASQLEHARLVRAFGLGLSKWLLKVCMSTHPKVAVKLLKSYSYRIEQGEPDMLSLTFRFEPIIHERVDDSGLGRAPTAAATPVPTEESLGIALAESVGSVCDVDQLLADDPTMMEKVTAQAATVLQAARYHPGKFRAWVADTPTFGDKSREDRGIVAPTKPA